MCRLVNYLAVAALTFAVGLALALAFGGLRRTEQPMTGTLTLTYTRAPEPPAETKSAPAPCNEGSLAVTNLPISGGILNGKAISLPKPAYPAIAKAAHVSGPVSVQVTINECGAAISARALDGHPLLQAAAVQAAYAARFSPTKLSGQPVRVTGVITYNFVLTD